MSAGATHPARILVADDHRATRKLLVQILASRGYEVVEAVDGRHAADVIDSARPDLLILDLVMPRADGYSVLEALETRAEGFLPVIVVSAVTERAERVRALHLGAHEFITKPVDAEELCVRVATLLALKTAREECDSQSRLLAGYNERLEYEVVKRTEGLREANLRLEAASKHKDEFIAVVSHELRTPLTAIAGAAENLIDEVAGSLAPEQRDLVDLVVGGADRLGTLVEDLVQFAELRTGRAQLECQPTPFASVVEDAATAVAARAAAAGIRLEVRADVPEEACVDARRLFCVVTKLLDNAIRFTPAGGRVAVRAWSDGESLHCEVADTGVGIAPDALSRLFDLFRQLDMSTTRTAGGLGLGLALARAYVEGHGGTIAVRSTPGIGSVFEFTLPLQRDADDPRPVPIPTPGAPG